MTEKRQSFARSVLESMGAVIYNDHFVYTSGRHGSAYIDKTAIYTDPVAIRYLCRFLVKALPYELQQETEVVVGSALAGIALAHTMVLCLDECRPEAEPKIWFCFVEEDETGEKMLRPRFLELLEGRRVLIVDDVLNTGHTIKKTLDVVGEAGGRVIAIAALYDRQDWEPGLFADTPVFSLVRVKLQGSYAPEACPLCRAGIPINQQFGRGKEYIAGRNDP